MLIRLFMSVVPFGLETGQPAAVSGVAVVIKRVQPHLDEDIVVACQRRRSKRKLKSQNRYAECGQQQHRCAQIPCSCVWRLVEIMNFSPDKTCAQESVGSGRRAAVIDTIELPHCVVVHATTASGKLPALDR